MTVVTETEALEVLRDRMVGQRSGVVSVIDVRYEYPISHSNEEYLEVVLILSDPPVERMTWPVDDVHELCRRGEEEAERLRLAPPYLATVSSRPEPDDWDEQDGTGAAE
jgi:hypothetical protein